MFISLPRFSDPGYRRSSNGQGASRLMVASSRVLICEDFCDIFCAKVFNHVIHFRGPLISPAAKQRVEGLIQSVADEGGKIHLDGRGIVVPGYEKGNFVGPTVVEAVTTMRAYK